MRRGIALAAVIVLAAGVTGALGDVIDSMPNELVNPSFADGGAGWEFSPSVQFDSVTFGRHVALDPQGQGESGYVRQVVDDSLSPGWNPNYNDKLGQLTFWIYTTGNAYVKVGFDWWDRVNEPKPAPGSLADHFVLLPEQYASVGAWTEVKVPFDWKDQPGNNQPRWVSLELYFYGCTNGNDAAVDDVVFQSLCVPEPATLSLLAVGGIAILRKRR